VARELNQSTCKPFNFLATRIPDLSLTNSNFKKEKHQGSLSDQSAFDYPTVPQNCTKITKEDKIKKN
jgi:hypothetical protein